MKALIIAILSLPLFCVSDASADQIGWKFTVLTDGSPSLHSPGTVDYSHNLEQTLAVSLPPAMIREGWACVRDVVRNDHDGGFTCTNGQVEISNHVDCVASKSQRNEMTVWDSKKNVMFALVSECSK